jgi:hypothetical protein
MTSRTHRTAQILWPVAIVSVAALCLYVAESDGPRREPAGADLEPRAAIQPALHLPTELPALETAESGARLASLSAARVLVTSACGDPIPFALLRLVAETGRERTKWRTELDGTAAIPCAAGDRFDIEVVAAGYLPARASIVHESDAARQHIELQPAGVLHVTVVDSDGSAIEGVFVEVRPDVPDSTPLGLQALPAGWPEFLPPGCDPAEADGLARQYAATDARGTFLARALPCEQALLVVASERVPVTQSRVTIPAALGHAALELRIATHGCIEGHLVWDDGTPAAHVRVRSFERGSGGQLAAPIEADDAGVFRLCGLSGGASSWRIEVPGQLSRCTRIDAPVVDVGRIEIPRPCRTEVRLRLSGAPAALRYDGWRIHAYSGGKLVSSVGSERDGTTLLELPSGEVQLDLTRGGQLVCSQRMRVPCATLDFELDEHVAGLSIENPPLPAGVPCGIKLLGLAACARDGGRHTPPFFSVAAAQMDSLAAWDGAQLDLWMLPAGGYDVHLVDANGVDAHVGRVWLEAGLRARVVARPTGAGSIAGHVRGADGTPIADFALQACQRVYEVEGGLQRRRHARSAPSGEFALTKLPAGPWTVFPKSLGPESSFAVEVDVRPGETTQVELQGAPLGALDVQISAAGEPRAQVVAIVEPHGDGVSEAASIRKLTDRAGRVSFGELCEGEYDVHTTWRERAGGAWVNESRRVRVAAAATTSLAIDSEQARSEIRFTRDGSPFDAWQGGVVFSALGRSHLRVLPGSQRAHSAALGPGPHLFLLYAPPEFPRLDPDQDLNHCHVAYVPDVAATAPTVTVELRGADVVVHARGAGAALPLARLIRIGPFEDVWGKAGFDRLLYVDEPSGVRRFRDVPVGAVIELENAGWRVSGAVQRVCVTSETDIDIEWPPLR